MEFCWSVILLISSLSNIDLSVAVEESSIWALSMSESRNRIEYFVEEDAALLPCEAMCNLLDEGVSSEKEDKSPRSHNGTAKGDFHRCPSLQCQQCMEGVTIATRRNEASMFDGKEKLNCQFICQNKSSACLVGCTCVQDTTKRKGDYQLHQMFLCFLDIDGRSKHPWHLTKPTLHCQNIKAWLEEASVYFSWRLEYDKQIGKEISGSTNWLKNTSFIDSRNAVFHNMKNIDFEHERMDLTMTQNEISPPRAFFVIEIRGENYSGWHLLDKTSQAFLAVEGLKPDIQLQVRVMAFDTDGLKIGQLAVSPWIRTLKANMKPKPVQNIWITNTTIGEHRASSSKKSNSIPKLNVEIAWDPSEDKLCYYDVAWFYVDGYRVKKNRKPETAYQALLKNIEYSESYNLSVTAVVVGKHESDGEIDRESKSTYFHFITPSCAEIWNYSLRKCRPPTPQNITYEIIPKSYEEDVHIYDLKITWSLPDYATGSNGLMNQYVQVQPTNIYSVADEFNIDTQTLIDFENSLHSFEKNVSADSNTTIFHSILLHQDFAITVMCESEGGNSGQGYVFVKLPPHLPASKYHSTIEIELLIAIIIILFLLILSTTLVIFIVRWCGKQTEKQRTGQYFEEVDKVKVAEEDISEIGEMLERPTRGRELEMHSSEWASERGGARFVEMEKSVQEEADEFEISLDRLLIREVLGEGAFGVVRKGYYSHHGISNIAFPVDDLAPTNSPLWETVAVKMLREGASVEEEKQLIHEMETLKSLGRCSHPNVVSLIGCYTGKIKSQKLNKNPFWVTDAFGIGHPKSKPRLLLLVEHCALGDLRNFLQKLWRDSSKSSPPQIRSNFFQSGDKITKAIERKEIKYINEISPKNFCNGNLKYADLDHSSAKEDFDNESKTILGGLFMTNYTYGMPSEPNEDGHECREAIDANTLTPAYLLSYARQIVMGMEYLSGQKVVHRDLAARNILLCRDGRTVKISDFGMSRDIYLQNVYHKAFAHEKLPIKWMALEALLHQLYSTQSDIWSFGVLLWEIVTLGGTPYPGIATSEIFKLLQSGYRMERPLNCSLELYQLMCWCWKEKPSERPTFSQLHLHLENLLQQNSASTYLTLPGGPLSLVRCSSEDETQISKSLENCNVINYKNETKSCLTHFNNDVKSNEPKIHPENHSFSNLKKSSNLSSRQKKGNTVAKSEISFDVDTVIREGADYLKPIPAHM